MRPYNYYFEIHFTVPFVDERNDITYKTVTRKKGVIYYYLEDGSVFLFTRRRPLIFIVAVKYYI